MSEVIALGGRSELRNDRPGGFNPNAIMDYARYDWHQIQLAGGGLVTARIDWNPIPGSGFPPTFGPLMLRVRVFSGEDLQTHVETVLQVPLTDFDGVTPLTLRQPSSILDTEAAQFTLDETSSGVLLLRLGYSYFDTSFGRYRYDNRQVVEAQISVDPTAGAAYVVGSPTTLHRTALNGDSAGGFWFPWTGTVLPTPTGAVELHGQRDLRALYYPSLDQGNEFGGALNHPMPPVQRTLPGDSWLSRSMRGHLLVDRGSTLGVLNLLEDGFSGPLRTVVATSPPAGAVGDLIDSGTYVWASGPELTWHADSGQTVLVGPLNFLPGFAVPGDVLQVLPSGRPDEAMIIHYQDSELDNVDGRLKSYYAGCFALNAARSAVQQTVPWALVAASRSPQGGTS